jgi:type IV secretory pathway VirB6-like protein
LYIGKVSEITNELIKSKYSTLLAARYPDDNNAIVGILVLSFIACQQVYVQSSNLQLLVLTISIPVSIAILFSVVVTIINFIFILLLSLIVPVIILFRFFFIGNYNT